MPDGGSDDITRTHIQLTNDTTIGHYRIIEKIGAGGMGEVYLAEDTELNRKVALKFLPLHLCHDPDCRARFKREAQAAAKLDHPNIVSVFEVGEFQGRPFFSMQHVEGQSLKEVLAGKPLPLDRILQIGIQVCDGLQAAHESGITHRDIKPSNILIDSHGRARIVDFGLASVMGSDHLTKTGSTLGTVGYMSPEQVRGDKVDHRTDLFSFGVVLYELITGHAPFKADSDAATLHAITETKPELLARYRREIPAELQTIIDKALEKDVATRYHHADDLATDLKRLTSHSDTHPAVKRSKHRLAWSSLVIVGVIAGALVLRPWRIVIKPSEEAIAATKCVVIVPFKNQTGDPSLEPLGKMVADWATQSLMQTGLADVVPPEMLPAFDAGAGLKPFVEATRADIFVTGSYYRIGDSIQFQVQVVNTEGKLLQGIDPIYAPSAKVMDGAEAVRQRVLGTLAIILDERLLGFSLQLTKPPKFDAYQEYIRSRVYHTESDWAASLDHSVRAFELDTQFFEPLLGACAASLNLGQYAKLDSFVQFLDIRRSRLTVLQQLSLESLSAHVSGNCFGALEATRKGAKLAPGSRFAYQRGLRAIWLNRPKECLEALGTMNPDRGWARGWMQYWYHLTLAYHLLGEHEKELVAAQQAQRRYPESPAPFVYEVRALAAMGRIQEVRQVLKQSASLSVNAGATPAYQFFVAGMDLRAHGHEDSAVSFLDRAIEGYKITPAIASTSRRLEYAAALWGARRWSESKSIYEELAKESPDDINCRGMLGVLYARLGDRESAQTVSEWLKNLSRPYLFGDAAYYRARIAAILGQSDEAVTLLRKHFQEGGLLGWGDHICFDFESLWDYPPFIELMKPKG